jgi:hypothetical protein
MRQARTLKPRASPSQDNNRSRIFETFRLEGTVRGRKIYALADSVGNLIFNRVMRNALREDKMRDRTIGGISQLRAPDKCK